VDRFCTEGWNFDLNHGNQYEAISSSGATSGFLSLRRVNSALGMRMFDHQRARLRVSGWSVIFSMMWLGIGTIPILVKAYQQQQFLFFSCTRRKGGADIFSPQNPR
jgi:hypothetical protein